MNSAKQAYTVTALNSFFLFEHTVGFSRPMQELHVLSLHVQTVPTKLSSFSASQWQAGSQWQSLHYRVTLVTNKWCTMPIAFFFKESLPATCVIVTPVCMFWKKKKKIVGMKSIFVMHCIQALWCGSLAVKKMPQINFKYSSIYQYSHWCMMLE